MQPRGHNKLTDKEIAGVLGIAFSQGFMKLQVIDDSPEESDKRFAIIEFDE